MYKYYIINISLYVITILYVKSNIALQCNIITLIQLYILYNRQLGL